MIDVIVAFLLYSFKVLPNNLDLIKAILLDLPSVEVVLTENGLSKTFSELSLLFITFNGANLE